MRVLAGVAGLALLVVTWWSLLRTLVVPRGSSWLDAQKNRGLVALMRSIARLAPTYRGRDRILTWVSALEIFTSLLLWLLMFFVSYGLLIYATSDLTAGVAFREAGSSLFTLGYATTDRASLTALDFVAAATGPITIGLLIGYLPALYQSYQQREAEVTLLLARSGEPSWGPELLARAAQARLTIGLHELWPTWERWAAEVGESHTNFPVLIQMRSARPERTWLISLLCVMDAAAMNMALNPSEPQTPARLVIRQGVTCLRELAAVERIPYDADPSPDTPSDVTPQQFADACADLASLGFPMERPVAEAYLHFRGWRANYEALAYELAARIDAVPAPWSGPRRPPLPVIYPERPVNRLPRGDA